MKSLNLSELRDLQESGQVCGNYTVLLFGAPRMIAYMPNWPANRHVLCTASETFYYARVCSLNPR